MKERILNRGILYGFLIFAAYLFAASSAGNSSLSNYFSEEKTDSFVLFENPGFDSDVYIEINDSEDLTDKKCFTLSPTIPGFITEGVPTIGFVKTVDSDPREIYFLIMHNLPPPSA